MVERTLGSRSGIQWVFYVLGMAAALVFTTSWIWGQAFVWRLLIFLNGLLGTN